VDVAARVGPEGDVHGCWGGGTSGGDFMAAQHHPCIGSVATVSRVWRYPRCAPDPTFTDSSGRNFGPHNSATEAHRHFAPRSLGLVGVAGASRKVEMSPFGEPT